MRKIFLVFLSFTIYFNSFVLAHASAAELWKYEPTLKDMKVNVTAHKVDQYGSAVNDNTYKTQIDPKTAANKTAQGRVGMNRLLKVSGWGLVGAAALQALLEAVDWVIDPETQSIWRNKKSNNNEVTACSYTQDYSGQTFKVAFRDAFGVEHACPLTAAEETMRYYAENTRYVKKDSTDFIRWEATNIDITKGAQYFYFDFIFDQGHANAGQKSGEIKRSILPVRTNEVVKPDREVMTPDVLSDYINHNHPDYSNPELSPKLEPHYKPNEIIPPLWKPQTDYEYDNSPTVDIIKKDLDKQNPISPDKEIEPNSETGGMSLPNFCDWAKVVCDFFKDNSKDNNNDTDVQTIDEKLPNINTGLFKASGTCPPDFQYAFPLPFGGSHTISYSYATACTWFSKLYFVVVTCGWIAAYFIVMGIRKNE